MKESAQAAFDRRARILGIKPTQVKGTTEIGVRRDVAAEFNLLLDDVERAQQERDEARAAQLKAERALAKAASEYSEEGNPLVPLLAQAQKAKEKADADLTQAQHERAEALAMCAQAKAEAQAERQARITAEDAMTEERAARERLENKPPTVIENVKEVVVQVPAPVQPTQARQPKSFSIRVTQRDGANRVRDIKLTPEF